MIGISHHGPAAHAQFLVLGIVGNEVLAVGDNGVVVLQLVVGHIGVVQEAQFLEPVEGRDGAVPHLLPLLLQGQILDVGSLLCDAFRMGIGRLTEPTARLFLTAGGIVVAARGRQHAAVGGMRLGGQVHQGVEACPVQLQNLGIHPAGKIADEHPLGGRRDVLRGDERLHAAEVFRIVALVTVNLGQADDGRHIAAVQGQCLFIAHLRQGVGEFAQIIVRGGGEDGGR